MEGRSQKPDSPPQPGPQGTSHLFPRGWVRAEGTGLGVGGQGRKVCALGSPPGSEQRRRVGQGAWEQEHLRCSAGPLCTSGGRRGAAPRWPHHPGLGPWRRGTSLALCLYPSSVGISGPPKTAAKSPGFCSQGHFRPRVVPRGPPPTAGSSRTSVPAPETPGLVGTLPQSLIPDPCV